MTGPRRTGYANLPLHGRETPPRLFQRMVRIGRTPYRLDRETYDRTIETMNRALSAPEVARSERVAALKRLARLAPAT
jgi:hypothetical protein